MRGIAAPLVKIGVFAVVTVLLTGILGATIANTDFGVTSGYLARFTDASGLQGGDDVRIAGVKVGQVDEITVASEGDETRYADVRFSIAARYKVAESATAVVKYRNLVGQRYLSLSADLDGRLLPPGGMIPVEHTQPALNLTVLFNGFKPLFQALDPEQVNQLSYEIIQTFQGEGGTIESLLRHTASLTTTIASKDEVIGQVIGNLNSVLATVNQRGPQLGNLIDQTQQLVTGLAQERDSVGDAASALSDLTNTTAGLVQDVRQPLQEDIAHLGVLSGTLSDSGPLLDDLLGKLPGNLDKFTRTLSYGSWYNYFLCNISGTIGISSLHVTLPILPLPATEEPARCKTS